MVKPKNGSERELTRKVEFVFKAFSTSLRRIESKTTV